MFPDQAKNYRTYESIPKVASTAAKKLIWNTAVAGSQGFVATGVGVPGGTKTVIKKTGGKQPGILLFAFIAEKILRLTAIKTENTAQGDAHMNTAMVRTRKKPVTRQERRPVKPQYLKTEVKHMENQTCKKCPNCGKGNDSGSNFCEFCGSKLSKICIYCWVKNKGNFECGYDYCPGVRLFALGSVLQFRT